MKFRKGFVTNSSSTSYICDISGEKSDVVWDSVSAQECGYAVCSLEHIFLEEFTIEVSDEEILEWLKPFRENMRNWYEAEDYEDVVEEFTRIGTVSEEEREDFINWCRRNIGGFEDSLLPIECPICQMQEFSTYDLQRYLEKKTNVTDEEVLEYVKSKNKRRRRTYTIDHVDYALMKLKMSMKEVKDEIREKFKNYKEFNEYLRQKG